MPLTYSVATSRPITGGAILTSGSLSGGASVGAILNGSAGGTAFVQMTKAADGVTQTSLWWKWGACTIPVGSTIYQYVIRLRWKLLGTFVPNNGQASFNLSIRDNSSSLPPAMPVWPNFKPQPSGNTFNGPPTGPLPPIDVAGTSNLTYTPASIIFIAPNGLEVDYFLSDPNSSVAVSPTAIGTHTPNITCWLLAEFWPGANVTNDELYEAYMDVYYVPPPITTITAPSGAVTVGNPLVTWSATTGTTSIQGYQMLVYTDTVYTGGGFDPLGSAGQAVYNSLGVYNSLPNNSINLPVTLLNTVNYRVYIRTIQVGTTVWGPFTFSSFNTAFSLPGTPTAVSATPNAANARYSIAATGAAGTVTSDYFEVQRSDDAGVTWADIRNGNGILAGSFPVLDYESVPMVTPQYRVRSVHSYPLSQVTYSPWVTVAAPAALVAVGWRLKNPLVPAQNMTIEMVPPFSFTRREPQAKFDAVGRYSSIYISDGQKGIEGTVKIRTRTLADYNSLWTLVGAGNALILEDWSFGRRWYVKFGDSGTYTTVTSAPDAGSTLPLRHLHEASYTIREVAAP